MVAISLAYIALTIILTSRGSPAIATILKLVVNASFYASIIAVIYQRDAKQSFALLFAVATWSYLFLLVNFDNPLRQYLDAAIYLPQGYRNDTYRVTVNAMSTLFIAYWCGRLGAFGWLMQQRYASRRSTVLPLPD